MNKLKEDAINFPLEVFFLRDDDIPQYVYDGVADVGFVGENVVYEKNKDIDVVSKLGFGRCRLSIAVPKNMNYTSVSDLKNLKIATSYTKLLQNFLNDKKLNAEIHEISGSVEIAPGIGLADAICDLVSSGSTLLTNGLLANINLPSPASLQKIQDSRHEILWWEICSILHDIGKPASAADGHFYRHEAVGAELAGDLLRTWHQSRSTIETVSHLVAQHMFNYDDAWSDGAVRRFIVKVGRHALDDLFALREADNIGSGLPGDAGGLADLRTRVAAQLAANVALDRSGLAIDGDALIERLELRPGPIVGRLLDGLVERVVADPAVNEPGRLVELAGEMLRSIPARTEDG